MNDPGFEIPESKLIENPRLLKDLVKLKELELKIAQNYTHQKLAKGRKGKFRWKHFFIYIIPALIQVGTIYAAYLAIVKSKFFESANYYAEARKVRLETQEDSLKSHKSKLFDSIKLYSSELCSQKYQIANFNTQNSRLSSMNSSLSQQITKQTRSIHDLDINYYSNLIEEYPESFYSFKNMAIEKLVSVSETDSEHTRVIRAFIDDKLKGKINDKLNSFAEKIKYAAIGYLCFKAPVYRAVFLNSLKAYSALYIKNMGDQDYPQQLMNILRYAKWGESLINENFEVVFNDALAAKNKEELCQIASWTTYHPLETGDEEKIKLMPNYWRKQHEFLISELSNAFFDPTLVVRNQNFYRYYKTLQLSLLCECPQAYFSLEAEFLKRNFTLFKAMNKDRDSINLSLSAREKDGAAELYDLQTTPKIRFFMLLSHDDIKGYSTKVFDIYNKTIAVNHIISFDNMAFTDDSNFENATSDFEKYYRDNQEKFKFWLSAAASNQIEKQPFQEKLLTLKL